MSHERTEPTPRVRTLPERWRERGRLMQARRGPNKVDVAYVDGYTDALTDCAGWLDLAVKAEARG